MNGIDCVFICEIHQVSTENNFYLKIIHAFYVLAVQKVTIFVIAYL